MTQSEIDLKKELDRRWFKVQHRPEADSERQLVQAALKAWEIQKEYEQSIRKRKNPRSAKARARPAKRTGQKKPGMQRTKNALVKS